MTNMSMVKRLAQKPQNCTEFGLHKSQVPGTTDKVIDFSEYKLQLMIKQTTDSERKVALLGLLADYRMGKIALAWEAGFRPIFVPITKDTSR